MLRTKRIQDDPILTLRTDSSGKPTEKSINDLFALFDMEKLFENKNEMKKSEQNNNNAQTSTKK